MDTLIIIEGPQGVGKTTFTNRLREKMSSADLYRLSGIKDKTVKAKEKVKQRYANLLEYMKNSKNINMIFDRTFFSEEVYSRLGYKPYSFSATYNELLEKLDNLNFEIYLIILYLEDTSEYKKRIGKRNKHQYQEFDEEESIKQQEEYLKIADEVKAKTKNIKVIKLNNNINTSSKEYEENINKVIGKN